jgi:hypothetical protein
MKYDEFRSVFYGSVKQGRDMPGGHGRWHRVRQATAEQTAPDAA